MITTILILILGVLSYVFPIVLGIGLAMWWRRTRHWSFAVLALAMVVFCVGQIVISVDQRRLPDPKASDNGTRDLALTHHMERVLAVNALFYVVLIFGGTGLVFAARDAEDIKTPNKALEATAVPRGS
jgi:hypothetical protein